MIDQASSSIPWRPGRAFYAGLALVLLANLVPFVPGWYTFIHMWRAEIAASVLLGCTLSYLFINRKTISFDLGICSSELKLIILPIAAFILWSYLSALWAPSWKSALHHSFIWTQYLIFYLIFRQMLTRGAAFGSLLTLFVAALALYSIPAVIEYCAYLSFGGASTIGMRYAKYGEQIVTLMPLLLLLVVRTQGRKFALGAAAVTTLWLLIFCSFGRINYFLFAAGIGAVFAALIISRSNRRYVPRFVALVFILGLSPAPLHVFSGFAQETKIPLVARMNDSDGISNSNNFRKLMVSIAGQMIATRPVNGVGADNFGMQVNHYREIYGAANPDNVDLANAEDEIPAHAHNEFVQIVAELGVVGGAIFLWLLAGIAYLAFRSLRGLRSGSLYPIVGFVGVAMFLASSAVSAYSFRVIPNGILFFFMLAFAVTRTLGKEREPERQESRRWLLRPAFAAGVLACIGLAGYSLLRVSSVIVTARANQTQALEDALPLYELAMRLDNENPDVRQNLGMRLFKERRYSDAIPYLESAISIGRAPSSEFSYLATSKSLAGDDRGAEAALSTAASLYPRSPFVLTKYASVLEKNGKTAESQEVFARATQIDERAAATWQKLIASGPKALTELAARDKSYSHVMDLRPQSSIYAVVTERFILFPEEQKFSFSSSAFAAK